MDIGQNLALALAQGADHQHRRIEQGNVGTELEVRLQAL
jgi:hypothetical protein